MLRCCICDDDPRDLAELQALAEDFSGAHPELALKLQTFSDPRALWERVEERGGFDIYLLDVLMPNMEGMELAQRVRARKEPSEIVFLTVSREYALEAFDIAACDYLVKPIEKERFAQAMLRATGRFARPEEPAFLLKTKEGLRRVPFGELVAVESFNHDRVCTMTDGARCVTTDTLTSLMERLGRDPRFFSPHRAYIINLEHITALNADNVTLVGGQQVPVAQATVPALKRAYVEYLSQARR